MPQASKPLLPQQCQGAGRSEDSSRGFVEAPYSRQQKTATASERSVQEPSIEEAAVPRRVLGPQDEPAKPVGPCVLEPIEEGASSGLAAPFGLPSHPFDAAIALHARRPFRARTEDAR